MMGHKPIALVKMDTGSEDVIAYACGKCGTVAAGIGKGSNMFHDMADAKAFAERHCGPWTCEKCGAEHNRSYQPTCNKCFHQGLAEYSAKRERELFEKAEKVPAASYDGPVYWDGSSYNDGFFASLDDLLDWCACEDDKPPDYVWPCYIGHPSVDFDAACESALCDTYEGAELDAEDELREFLKQWNAKQTSEIWEPRHNHALIIEYPCDVDEEEKSEMRRHAETFTCPKCGATPGVQCIHPANDDLGVTCPVVCHAERNALAEVGVTVAEDA
jgi:hypothetical protein